MTMKKVVRNILMAATLAGFGLGVGLGTANAEPSKKAMRSWKAKCASCHGEDGKGQTEQGKKMGVGDMTQAAFWKEVKDGAKVVADGLKREKGGKQQEMKPFKDKLSADEIKELVDYAQSLAK